VPNVIDLIEAETKRKKVPELRPGDTVRVHAKVVEGTRERVQVFEGIVMRLRGDERVSALAPVVESDEDGPELIEAVPPQE